jgi:hypothetical protein
MFLCYETKIRLISKKYKIDRIEQIKCSSENDKVLNLSLLENTFIK